MRVISPSILSANFGELNNEITMLNQSNADWIHIDVMDGVFVPNISFGFPIVESVKKLATKFIDVHLMIVNPENYVERFVKAGADLVVFHYEATTEHRAIIETVKNSGAKVGVSVKPNTPISAIKEFLPLIDVALVMSVEPGFGGQKFIEGAIDKARELKEMIQECGAETLIQIDGGATLENAKKIFDAGVDVLVAGSTIFSADDPIATINQLLNV